MTTHDPAAAATYSDYVLDRLRDDIISGALQPETKLAVKELAGRYGVGASPVREALHRLAGEGFVNFVGQRGFTVAPISLDDLDDLTLLRQLVEEAAVRQAIARGDDAWEARIVGAFHMLERQVERFAGQSEETMAQYDVVHRAFHVSLYAGVVSPRLAHLHASLFDQAYRYRKTLHHLPLTPEEVLAEHRRLMQVVLSRDADNAAIAVRNHLELTRSSAQRYFGKHWRMP